MKTARFLPALMVLACGASLAPAGEFILRVVDPSGAAIAGASVAVSSPAGKKPAISAATGLEGGVLIRGDPPVQVRVTAIGFESLIQTLSPGANETVTLQLQPATLYTTLDVVVRDVASDALSPGSTSVGSALEIDRGGARTIFDAVEKLVPSAFVTRRGLMGYGIAQNGTGVVTIRGIGETPNSGVLVVVDGRPDYMGLMGHPLPDFYSLSDAGSVSVTRGPASVLYGSNAMGGVIEIRPPALVKTRKTGLTASIGSFRTGQHRASHAGTLRRTYLSLAGGVTHTRGDRARSAFRSLDGSLGLARDLSEFWKVSWDGQYGHFHVEDPGPLAAPLPDSFARVGRGGFSLGLSNAYVRTWGYTRLFSSHGRHLISDGFRSADSTTGLRFHQHISVAPRWTLEAGSDFVRYGGRANNILSAVDYGEHHIITAAGFSRVQWEANHHWRLDAGIRLEHNSQFGGIAVPEFALTCRLSGDYSLSAAVAKGFRNPTIRELYLFPAPNPVLQPERLWNFQATFQARPRGNLSGWITGYYADLSNLIVMTGRFPNVNLSNAGRGLNRGVEGSVSWKPRPWMGLDTGYAYLRSTNLGPNIPAHKANYSLNLEVKGRAFIHLGGITVNRRWANLQRTRQLPGYTVATLKCTIPVSKRWNLFALVDNLFDRRYEVVAGYPMPGINAMGGVALRF